MTCVPGDFVAVGRNHSTTLVRPFFYADSDPAFDGWTIDECLSISPNTWVLAIACFPDGSPVDRDACGAIVIVDSRGLWWWCWDKQSALATSFTSTRGAKQLAKDAV